VTEVVGRSSSTTDGCVTGSMHVASWCVILDNRLLEPYLKGRELWRLAITSRFVYTTNGLLETAYTKVADTFIERLSTRNWSWRMRKAAIEALGRMPVSRVTTGIVCKVAAQLEDRVRLLSTPTIRALRMMMPSLLTPETFAAVSMRLGHSDMFVREAASCVLGSLEHPMIMEGIGALLKASDWQTRDGAVRTFQKMTASMLTPQSVAAGG